MMLNFRAKFKSAIFLAALLFCPYQAKSLTYYQMSWGITQGTSPYSFGANLAGTWYPLGTVSSSGTWAVPVGYIVNGTTPILSAANSWSLTQTLTQAPIITALTGYVYCNGASACTASATIPVANIVNGSTAILSANNTWSATQTLTLAPIMTALTGYVYCNGSSVCSASTNVPVTNVVNGSTALLSAANTWLLTQTDTVAPIMKALTGYVYCNGNSACNAATTIPVGNIGSIAANTVITNATATSAQPTAFVMPSCSSASNALTWTSGTGFTCNTSITANIAAAGNLTGSTLNSGVTASSLTSFGSSPTLTTPNIGAATGTSLNLSSSKFIADSTGKVTALYAIYSLSTGTTTGITISNCGTSPTVQTGSNMMSGQLYSGGTATTSCQIAFATAYSTTAYCAVSPVGAANSGMYISTQSKTGFTVNYTSATSLGISYVCHGY